MMGGDLVDIGLVCSKIGAVLETGFTTCLMCFKMNTVSLSESRSWLTSTNGFSSKLKQRSAIKI